MIDRVHAAAAGAPAPAHPEAPNPLSKAASGFEAVFVRQLLSSAHIGGDAAQGYQDLVVDALSQSIEAGGGMGLGRRIEETLSHTDRAAHTGHGTHAEPKKAAQDAPGAAPSSSDHKVRSSNVSGR